MIGTAVAFELSSAHRHLTKQVNHTLMADPYAYSMGLHTIGEEEGITFPENVMVHSEKEPQAMVEDVQAICAQLGASLIRCVTFTFEMTESVGIKSR